MSEGGSEEHRPHLPPRLAGSRVPRCLDAADCAPRPQRPSYPNAGPRHAQPVILDAAAPAYSGVSRRLSIRASGCAGGHPGCGGGGGGAGGPAAAALRPARPARRPGPPHMARPLRPRSAPPPRPPPRPRVRQRLSPPEGTRFGPGLIEGHGLGRA